MEKLVVWRGISVVTVELAVKPHTKTLIRLSWKQNTRRKASEPQRTFRSSRYEPRPQIEIAKTLLARLPPLNACN
jgi:hypothetical protein